MPALTDVLANGIRAERSRRRLTQAQLAEMIGVHPATMSEIERGKRTVDLGELAAVCRALDLPLIDLLKGADPGDLRALGL
jgi:transcriptional regulator with XRE-family HTH domain